MNNNFVNFKKKIVDLTNLNRIFGIVAEEVFNAIPKDVMSEGMKDTVKKATDVIIPVITGIYKNAFLSVYEKEFSDEEFGQLLHHYGPGSAIWSFFNSNDFLPWLRKTIRELIQKRTKDLDLATLNPEETRSLAQISLDELVDQLPEQIKSSSADYIGSDLYLKEAALGDKITAEGIKHMTKIEWYDLLEKSGITLPD